jgi:hypothetical protein
MSSKKYSVPPVFCSTDVTHTKAQTGTIVSFSLWNHESCLEKIRERINISKKKKATRKKKNDEEPRTGFDTSY